MKLWLSFMIIKLFCLIFKWIKNLFLRIFIFMGMNHRNKRYGFTWRMKSFYWTQIMNEWIASIKIPKRFMLLTKIITRKSVVRLHFWTFLCWNYFKMLKLNSIELLLELLMFVFVWFVLVSDGESLIWNRNWNCKWLETSVCRLFNIQIPCGWPTMKLDHAFYFYLNPL